MGIVQKKSKGISAAVLKAIAMITMFIDHFAATVLQRILDARGINEQRTDEEYSQWLHVGNNMLIFELNSWMRTIGRLAFPLFVFLLAEGFFYTKNQLAYLKKLAIFAVISEIPFDLALYDSFHYAYHQNVFFTLALGVCGLMGYCAIKENPCEGKIFGVLKNLGFFGFGFMLWFLFVNSVLGRILAGNGFAGALYTTVKIKKFSFTVLGPTGIAIGIGVGLSTLLIFNFSLKGFDRTFVTREAIAWFPIIGAVFLADLLRTDYGAFGVFVIALVYLKRVQQTASLGACATALSIYNPSEISAFVDVFIVKLYNGKKGHQIKWLGYVFYPGHLLILTIICYLCKL